MKPELKKDLDAIAKEVAEKFSTTRIIPELIIASTLVQYKLSILGANARDKKIDIPDTCEKLRTEVANLANIAVKLLPDLAADPVKQGAIQAEIDKLMQPVIMFHFMGIGEGRKPS